MEPYVNSIVKEEMRRRNEQLALGSQQAIEENLRVKLSLISKKARPSMLPWLVLGGVIGGYLSSVGGGFQGIGLGLAVGFVVWLIRDQGIKSYNANIDREKQRLGQEAQRQIQEEFSKADQRTLQEAAAYDREVKMYAQKVLAKAESIRPMVDSTVDMFQRMISHADAGSSIRFIQADFTYLVMTAGIKYSYSSQYTNPQDDFNFNLQRYRDLSTPAECEGLAQALAKLTVSRMKSLYPPNSINITLSHKDAQVTLRFRGANKNFIPARDIM